MKNNPIRKTRDLRHCRTQRLIFKICTRSFEIASFIFDKNAQTPVPSTKQKLIHIFSDSEICTIHIFISNRTHKPHNAPRNRSDINEFHTHTHTFVYKSACIIIAYFIIIPALKTILLTPLMGLELFVCTSQVQHDISML